MKLKKHPVIKFFLSLRLTVFGLVMLFILTFWGTVDQVDHGLLVSTKRFFHSWVVLAWGIVPFPGGQLVQWILFINLLLVTILRIPRRWDRSGLLLVHFGLLSLLMGGFWTYRFALESHVTLREGEETNLSRAYHEWELSLWQEKASGQKRDVVAYDLSPVRKGSNLGFKKFDLVCEVQEIYKDCTAHTGSTPVKFKNASGIVKLNERTPSSSPEEHTPGAYLLFKDSSGGEHPIVLYGGETTPTLIETNKGTFSAILRHKRSAIPVRIKILDVIKEDYPGTTKAKSYESHVVVREGDSELKVRIYMNHPYRIGDYTFFQSGYSADRNGETTTLAVVKNSGRMIPYISSLLTTLGLILHFFIALIKTLKKKKSQ